MNQRLRSKLEASPKLDIINEEKTKEWNESISPRLEQLRAWFSGDEWNKALHPYLAGMLKRRREHLEMIENDTSSDQFIKGQIAMLKEFLLFPQVIEKQISLIEANKKAVPTGDAGY